MAGGAVLAALVFGLCARAAQAVEIDTLVGFGQSTASGARYRPETWTPLTVYLTGQGVRGIAQLQVSVRIAEHTTLYTRSVSLRDGPINEASNFTIRLSNPDGATFMNGGAPTEIEVRLLMDGRTLAGPRKAALPGVVGLETFNVLGLTRDGSGLNLLNKKKLGLFHRHFNPANLSSMTIGANSRAATKADNGINPNATLQVLYTDSRALPAQPQGYEMIDAIALGDQPPDNLSDDQLDALRGYVRSGGLLVVSGGGDLARLKSRFYEDLLPVKPAGAVVARDLPALAGRYRTPLALAGGAALTESTLKPGAAALLSAENGEPLISSRPYGCGVVVFTAFDYLDPNIKGWEAAPALWRDLLRCGNGSVSARDVLAASTENNRSTLNLGDALAGKRATSAPPMIVIGIFCGAYLILLVPVNYFVLKKLDKREMTWITAPTLIAGFTVASYLMARSIKGGDLNVNRGVVLETQANSDQVAGYGQLTVYAPRRAAFDISFGNPDDAGNPYRALIPGEIFTSPGQSPGVGLTIENDRNTMTLRNTLIKLWDKRSFDTPVAVDPGGSVEAVTRALPATNSVEVTVVNHTRFPLRDCSLIAGQAIPVGDLAPGAAVTRTVLWNTRGGAINLPVPVPAVPDSGANGQKDAGDRRDTPELTRARIAAALLQSLASGTEQNPYDYQMSAGYGRGVNALVGWVDGSLLDVRVDGRKPEGVEVNLLVVDLPTPVDAPAELRARTDPFAAPPALDLEDEIPAGTTRQGVFR